MKRKLFSALVVTVLAASMSLAAFATPGPPPGTTTSTETITANVLASCTVTQNGALNFPEYKPAGNPAHSLTADLGHTYDSGSADAMMQCTANTPYSVTVGSTSRNMVGTVHGGLLPYTYNVLGTFTLHPVGGGHFTCPMSPPANTASSVTDSVADPVTIQFAGCIDPGKWPIPDTYTDAFTFTVSF